MLEICMQLPSEMIFPWRSRASAHWKVAKLNASWQVKDCQSPHSNDIACWIDHACWMLQAAKMHVMIAYSQATLVLDQYYFVPCRLLPTSSKFPYACCLWLSCCRCKVHKISLLQHRPCLLCIMHADDACSWQDALTFINRSPPLQKAGLLQARQGFKKLSPSCCSPCHCLSCHQSTDGGRSMWSSCRYQQRLQQNLMYLAAIADAQPQQPLPPQPPSGPVMQQPPPPTSTPHSAV